MRGRLPHSIPSHPPTLPPAPVWPALLWLAGLAALLARCAWTHAGFAWLRLRHFIPAAETLRERVQNLATRLGLRRRVRVLASERLRAPAAFGWVRPGVGVPGDFTDRFAPAQQDVMLAHELAHLAARDPLWQLLADLVAAALWWHPLAWVARRQHRIAGELAADDASLALPDGPVVLAECLLALGHEAADCPRAALGMAGFRSQLGRRVERLLTLPRRDWQAPSRARLALQTAVALLALAALALLPGCAANRTAGEAPSHLVAKWLQAKKAQTPVGDDVRSLQLPQTPTASQRLVTSSPTAADGALGQTRPTNADTTNLKALAGRLVQAQTEATRLRFDKGPQHPDVRANEREIAAVEKAIGEEKEFLQFLGRVQPQNPDVETTLAIAMLTRRHQERLAANIELESRAGDLGPQHPDALRMKAIVSQLTKQVEAAKQRLLLLNPPKPGASLQPAPVADDVRRLTSPQTPDAKPQTPPATVTPAAAPATVLAVGDHLRVEMNFSRAGSNQTLAFRGLVASAGYVPIPRVTRAVFVAGKTIDEAQRMICDQLVKDGYEAPRVTLTKVSPLLPSPPGSVFNLQSNGYQIRPGDEVVVSVWGREDLRTRAKVQPDGGMQLPLVGSVLVGGSSVAAARDAVKAAYQPAHLAEAHVAVLLVRLAEPIPKGISFPTYSTLPDLVVLHPPTLEKLARLRLPEVQYDGLRLPEVLKLLAADAKKHDPDMQGLGFETQWGLFTGGAFTPPQPSQPTTRTNASGSVYTITSNRPLPRSRIRLNFDMDTVLVNIPSALRDISALDALDAIVKAADYPIRFTIETNRVIFWQRPTNEPSPTPKPPAPKPGASLQPVPVGDAVRRLTSPQTPDAKPQTPPASQRLVTSSPTVVKPVAASSLGAGKILRKLEEIVLPEIHFDGVTLAEVMKRLDADARKFDPEKKGLNFLINDVAPPAPLLDASGNPVPVAQPVPLSEGLIRISTTLRNLTLRQVLDVICKTAELPTQFSVEEYAIVFIPRGPGNAAYFSRIFRVNPNTFIQGLQGVVGNPVLGVGVGQGTSPVGAGTSTGPVRATVPATVPATQRTAAEANALVRQFFQSAGVASLGATNSSTQVFFNPENGLIIARGTTNDLRVIEQAIQKVQPPPAPAKK